MSKPSLSSQTSPRRFILLAGLLFLFFFQLLSDFVTGIYAFGLLGTGIPNEIISVLFLFSPLILFLFKKNIPNGWLAGFAWLGLVCRVIEVTLDTRGQMLLSGFGTAAFLIFFAGIYSRVSVDGRRFGRELTSGLILGVLLSVLFRTVNAGTDLTNMGMFRLVGWLLALLAAFLLLGWNRADRPGPEQEERIGFGRLLGCSLGITSVWLLLFFAFTSPNVISRWTGMSPMPILAVMLVSWIAFLWWWLRFGLPPRNILVVWSLVFSLALILSILPHQVVFPTVPDSYPIAEPEIFWWNYLPVYLMAALSPVIFAAFAAYTRDLYFSLPTSRQLGGAFSIASLYFLLLIFGQVFTTVYDYIPVVGPFFRDKFWLVFLIPCIGVILSLLLVKDQPPKEHAPDHAFQWGAGLIALTAVLSLLVFAPNPPDPPEDAESLRVLTYNVQQGYNADGQLNFNGQLAYIKSAAPDIVGIQETDTNRIANGNADLVGYFAAHLNMYSYYGPKVVPGTFGIALLSRYPIEDARTYYLYSEGEQVAVIEAKIIVGDRIFTVFVNHLGNSGPIVQTEQFLQLTAGKENVIAMGDYNFRPYEDQYSLVTSALEDVFMIAPQAEVPDDFDFSERIDHVFVSAEMKINLAQYLTEPESDHPALLVEIGW